MKITNEKIAQIVLGWELRPNIKWGDGSMSGPRWRTIGDQWPSHYKENDLPLFISDLRYAVMVWQDMINQGYELSLIHKEEKFAFVPVKGKNKIHAKVPKKLWCGSIEKAIYKGSLFIKDV